MPISVGIVFLMYRFSRLVALMYIRRTLAVEWWVDRTDQGFYRAWWHHSRPRATHKRAKRRSRYSPNVWNIRPGGALAGGTCISYWGGAIGYPRIADTGRRLRPRSLRRYRGPRQGARCRRRPRSRRGDARDWRNAPLRCRRDLWWVGALGEPHQECTLGERSRLGHPPVG